MVPNLESERESEIESESDSEKDSDAEGFISESEGDLSDQMSDPSLKSSPNVVRDPVVEFVELQ